MTVKIKYLVVLLAIGCFQSMVSQNIEIEGYVQSQVNIENIHVINKTENLFTITDKFGGFKMDVKLNDTLVFSSVQHKTRTVVVNENMLIKKKVEVLLEEQINQLDEVIVGKVLTGDLFSDINNIEGKPPINFYDVGIPGYTGKPATQSERRLSQAGEFKPIMLLGLLGGSMPLDPIINGISGRTNTLKNRVKIEEKEALMQSIKAHLLKDFLVSNPLPDDLVMDFFYFCADDKNFIKQCNNQTDFKILIFLRMKYREYKGNLDSKNE